MDERTFQRLEDILDAIVQIELLTSGKKQADLETDRFFRAAFERFVEIISEASRGIPEALKSDFRDIPWSRIAAIGNHLRHAYHRVDTGILWALADNGELSHLKSAVAAMISSRDQNRV